MRNISREGREPIERLFQTSEHVVESVREIRQFRRQFLQSNSRGKIGCADLSRGGCNLDQRSQSTPGQTVSRENAKEECRSENSLQAPAITREHSLIARSVEGGLHD
jgi:hypothetical protein